MTEPTSTTPDAENPEAVDENLDTTGGDRDPLTTDEGLAAAAESMPAVAEDRPVDDTTGSATSFDQPVQDADAAGLAVDGDGTDPLAELARPGDDN